MNQRVKQHRTRFKAKFKTFKAKERKKKKMTMSSTTLQRMFKKNMMTTTLKICVRDPLSYRSTTAKGSKGVASTMEVIGVSIGKTHVTADGE
eukprot:1721739-Amphidinium_carterae.1